MLKKLSAISIILLFVVAAIPQTVAQTYVGIIPCSYQIFIVSGITYAQNCGAGPNTGALLFKSVNASAVISDAIGNLTSGGSIFIKTGTYALTSSIIGSHKNNITLSFANGATLFVGNGLDAPAISLTYANNWLISGVTINGNAANQGSPGTYFDDGIDITFSNNTQVDHANIYNVARYSFHVYDDVGHDGVTNSKFTDCGYQTGYQCITLGNAIGVERALYAINNEVTRFGDVGISNYGWGDIVTHNYIHDSTLTYSGGISLEAGGNDTINDNTIINCWQAIELAPISPYTALGNTNTISGNILEGTINYGIALETNLNTVTENVITQWDQTGQYIPAIYIGGSYNTVALNTLTDTIWSGAGIETPGNYNNILQNNLHLAGGNNGISVDNGASSTQVIGNQVAGLTAYEHAILINSGATGTVVQNNNLLQCAAAHRLSDSGTSTSIYTNSGYNPTGNITDAWDNANHIVTDGGNSGSPTNATTYTVWDSPKLITITVTALFPTHELTIQIDGQTRTPTNWVPPIGIYTFQLNPGQTILIDKPTTGVAIYTSGQ